MASTAPRSRLTREAAAIRAASLARRRKRSRLSGGSWVGDRFGNDAPSSSLSPSSISPASAEKRPRKNNWALADIASFAKALHVNQRPDADETLRFFAISAMTNKSVERIKEFWDCSLTTIKAMLQSRKYNLNLSDARQTIPAVLCYCESILKIGLRPDQLDKSVYTSRLRDSICLAVLHAKEYSNSEPAEIPGSKNDKNSFGSESRLGAGSGAGSRFEGEGYLRLLANCIPYMSMDIDDGVKGDNAGFSNKTSLGNADDDDYSDTQMTLDDLFDATSRAEVSDGFRIIKFDQKPAEKWKNHAIVQSTKACLLRKRASVKRVRFALGDTAEIKRKRVSHRASSQTATSSSITKKLSRFVRKSRHEFPSHPASLSSDFDDNSELPLSGQHVLFDWKLKAFQLMKITQLPFETVWESMVRGDSSASTMASATSYAGRPSPVAVYEVNQHVQVLDHGKWWDAVVQRRFQKSMPLAVNMSETTYYDVVAANQTKNGFIWLLHGVHPADMRQKRRFPVIPGTDTQLCLGSVGKQLLRPKSDYFYLKKKIL